MSNAETLETLETLDNRHVRQGVGAESTTMKNNMKLTMIDHHSRYSKSAVNSLGALVDSVVRKAAAFVVQKYDIRLAQLRTITALTHCQHCTSLSTIKSRCFHPRNKHQRRRHPSQRAQSHGGVFDCRRSHPSKTWYVQASPPTSPKALVPRH